MLEQKFIGKINTDDADRDLEGAVRDALNLIPQDGGLGATERAENVKGNSAISNDKLPNGTNKSIGQFSDKNNQRTVYFNYNSNNNHCIFVFERTENRIYKILESSVLNWTSDTIITGAGIVKDQLMWTDVENEIGSIDIEKGKNTFDVSEKRKWDILLVGNSAANFTVTVLKSDGVSEDISVTVDNIESELNGWIQGGVTAEKCENTVNIEEIVAGDIDKITVSGVHAVAPINIYSLPITERQTILVNYPLPCSPTADFETDTTRTINFVNEDAFQFSSRYVYFDDSSSTISPYSKILAKKDCGTSSQKVDNYIKVTFSDTQLTEEELTLIKNVEILFRIGNSGNFYKAVSLDRDEFFNGTYDFYNDGAYDTIDSSSVAKFFDSVPNKANAITVLKNRLFIGGYTEGYDTPCIDANVEVDIQENSGGVGNTWTITGRIRIVNRFLDKADPAYSVELHTNQPIHSRDGASDRDKWVYGGMGGVGGLDENVDETNHDNYQQYIPEGGFVVYLAGTNYFDISKQLTTVFINGAGNTQTAEVVSDDPIVYKTDTKGNPLTSTIEDGRTSCRRIMASDQMYSTFEIKGVPPGKYIVRVASPLASRDENARTDARSTYSLGGNIADWQSTSPPIINMNGKTSDYQDNVSIFYPYFDSEEVIELSDSGGTYELNGSDASSENGRAILIADLTDFGVTGHSSVHTGYLVDTGTPAPIDDDFVSSLRMEYQKMGVSGGWVDAVTNDPDFQMKTDHNGFWWFAWNGGIFATLTIRRSQIYNGGFKDYQTYFPFISDDTENNPYEIKHWNQLQYYDSDIADVSEGVIVGNPQQKDIKNDRFLTKYISYNHNMQVTDYGRTIIQGKVVDTNGNPLVDLFSQITKVGRNEKTDSEGFFNIVAYADEDLTLPEMSRSDILIIGKGDNACVSFTDVSTAFSAEPIYIQGFNNLIPFELSDIVITDLVENTASIHKRGGIYKWGLVYYDQALRSSFVGTNDSLRRRIPFITDDLGVTLPDQYSSPEFRYGNAFINWEINSQPPEWAHYYQWVRTKDTAHQSFFTWSANDVLYVKEWDLENEEPIETTFGSSNANEVYLDISNLQDYLNSNSDAQLGYNFTKGDRCILIKNEGEYFETYIDVEVKGQRGDYIIIENTGSLVELKEGLQFQVYTPKLQNETEIYYEIGECYEVLNPGTESRSHSVSSGTLTSGDAYIIGRNVTTDVGAVTEDYEHPTISDKETVRFSDIGRANIINKNAKTEYFFSSVRFSNPFIQNSYDNGLSSFNPLDKEDLPLNRGPINKMVGTTNVILTLHNTEATSLYIGEGFLHTADGGGLESKTDKIIGDERLLKGEYGTINPESVVEYDDVVYWWDQNKGEMIRYSNNGLTPLGLVAKYRNKLLEIQKHQKVNTVNSVNNLVYGGYNPVWDMALMTFKNINGEDVTVGFHERTDSFITRFSFAPELYTYIDTKLYSFKDGVLYEHDIDGVDRNTFYGVSYPSRVHIVSNLNNEIEKIYRSMGVKSNQPWSVPSIFNKDGQESNLITSDFIRRDDMYYANILRDINTAVDKLTGIQVPLRSGDVMRSQVMEIILENNNTSKVELDFVAIDFQESPGHLINR